MKQLKTQAIVLSRTDYGEADRILTLLTPDFGKLRLMARGVRKVQSKLAGGIELFSVSNITFIEGRGEIGTLISTRLITHYGHIVQNIDRTMLGYELIKLLNKATEDKTEAEYFELLEQAFEALNEEFASNELIREWFMMQLLRQAGHTPNMQTDDQGQKLSPNHLYNFNFEAMAFTSAEQGNFNADHIKFLRLGFSGNQPKVLQKVSGVDKLVATSLPIVQTMLKTHIRI